MKRPFFFASFAACFFLVNWPGQLSTPDLLESGVSILKWEEICLNVVKEPKLYQDGWDTLAQPRFWQESMKYGPDTILINIAKTREILGFMTYKRWGRLGERGQKRLEDSIRTAEGLGRKDEIYFTTGRRHFYKFEPVLPEIDKAIKVFEAEEVDPWYAQAILLIESPGRLQFSTEGAYGAFQLMEGVAKEVGLVINDTLDEREDFEKSAQGAARLIRRTCIPKAKVLAEYWQLAYDEDDLWFRLLVMHVYHAGFGNVRRVLRKIRPTEGGPQLIQKIWQTKGRRFGNASQNYSQIALATQMELDRRLQSEGLLCK